MPSPSAILAAALVAGSFTNALPPPVGSIGAGTASLAQIANPSFVRNGPFALAKAYRKYGAPIPDDLRSAVARLLALLGKRDSGGADATPEKHDLEFLTPVSIGTPAQVLNLDFDTGSSDLWVFSSETPESEVNGQTVYDPSKSSTAQKLDGATWEISYGDGSSSSGDVYMDTVNVGGVTVTSQAVEQAQEVSDQFTEDSASDGLLGLGFSKINTVQPVQQKTFFDNVQDALNAPVFTADLKHEDRKYTASSIPSLPRHALIVPFSWSLQLWLCRLECAYRQHHLHQH